MNNRSGAKRPYVPRACACGAEALYAVQVMVRTIGRGQSKANRRIKLGKATILCGKCTRNADAFIEKLSDSSMAALDQVRRLRRSQPAPDAPLFNQAEA
jgi:hypothetical protein